MIQKRSCLDCFPETHFIGENEISPIVVCIDHPIQGFQLIRTQQLPLLVSYLGLKGILEHLFVLFNVVIVEFRSEVCYCMLVRSAISSSVVSKFLKLIVHRCLPIHNEPTFFIKRSVTQPIIADRRPIRQFTLMFPSSFHI